MAKYFTKGFKNLNSSTLCNQKKKKKMTFKSVKIELKKMLTCKEDKLVVTTYCVKRKLPNRTRGVVTAHLIVP